MAIVVEDGQGRANANSYASVADVDEYFADRGVTDWAGANASDERKAGLLIQSTEWIDFKYAAQFKGSQLLYTQALQWPRQGIVDPSTGVQYVLPWMPRQLLPAVAMLSQAAAVSPLRNFAADPARAQIIERTVGPITRKFNPLTSEQISASRDFSYLDEVLGPILDSIGVNVDVVRG